MVKFKWSVPVLLGFLLGIQQAEEGRSFQTFFLFCNLTTARHTLARAKGLG
jgi:hypothetical protein